MVSIVQRMADIVTFIRTVPGGAGFAADLQRQGTEAVRGGINSAAWKTLMCNFASNPTQLQRLIGNDQTFNNTLYGLDSLAYMAGNVLCGTSTDTDSSRNMNQMMLDGLDLNLPSNDLPIPDCGSAEAEPGGIFSA